MKQDPHTTAPAIPGSRHPLLEVWTQAWPIIITMTSYTVMQFVDKLMVGQVGPLELAAQGNGGIWAFTPMAFAMGAMVVVNTWVSQHMGAGNPERVARYLWGALYLSIVVWLVVLLPWAMLLPSALRPIKAEIFTTRPLLCFRKCGAHARVTRNGPRKLV